MKVTATFEVNNTEGLTTEQLERKICESLDSLVHDGLNPVEWSFKPDKK